MTLAVLHCKSSSAHSPCTPFSKLARPASADVMKIKERLHSPAEGCELEGTVGNGVVRGL